MEKKDNINIAEILKDCSKGMKLYSLIFGEVKLHKVLTEVDYPIGVEEESGSLKFFSKEGFYVKGYYDTECILFPSSEMRDWSKFFKRGDVVFSHSAQMIAIFEGWVDSRYTEFKTSFSEHNDGTWSKGEVCSTKDFFLATEFDVKTFISKTEKHYHGKYNPETMQVEPVKPECPFKPFDKVLVRDNIEQEWSANMFSYYDPSEGNNFPYMCLTGCYHYCIPYEGNEHLLGTTDPYTEGGSE